MAAATNKAPEATTPAKATAAKTPKAKTPKVCAARGCSSTKIFRRGFCWADFEKRRLALLGPCSEEGCGKPVYGNGVCRRHFYAELRTRIPTPRARTSSTAAAAAPQATASPSKPSGEREPLP